MKVVLIGSSGHSGICISKTVSEDRNFVAVAPGSLGESMEMIGFAWWEQRGCWK